MRDFYGTDGGSIVGRACPSCSFDQTMIEFEPIEGATTVLEFPAKDWRDWFSCTGCGAVSNRQGSQDRARTLALREALDYERAHPSGPRLVIALP